MFLIPDTVYTDVLRFLADLHEVPLAVTDFEELCIATFLNRSRENATIREMLVTFLQLGAENDRGDWRWSIESCPLHFCLGIQEDCGDIVTRKLQGNIGRERTVPVRRDSCYLAFEGVDPPASGALNICVAECDRICVDR
jgi:hypothetical protein